jgi:hypothetical protein
VLRHSHRAPWVVCLVMSVDAYGAVFVNRGEGGGEEDQLMYFRYTERKRTKDPRGIDNAVDERENFHHLEKKVVRLTQDVPVSGFKVSVVVCSGFFGKKMDFTSKR